MAVDDSYTVSLLHMDGEDGSSIFIDESGKGWSAYGNAQIDTAQYKFGGSSGLFDGNDDKIYTSSHADFDFGSGNFTIDGWVRFGSLPSGAGCFTTKRTSTLDYPPFWVGFSNSTTLTMQATNGSSWLVSLNPVVTPSIDTWYHWAFVRYGNIFTAYWNGTDVGNTTQSFTLVSNAINVTIGTNDDNSQDFAGWLDEIRYSKGIARWTSNFTPPTYMYASGGNHSATRGRNRYIGNVDPRIA